MKINQLNIKEMEKTELRTKFSIETQTKFNVEWIAYNDYAEWLEKKLLKLLPIPPVVRHSIFLIEKGWIDSMENRNADGYEPFGYKLTEQEAKEFCESKGYWTDKDCWSVAYHPNKQMAKYRYKEIQYCA